MIDISGKIVIADAMHCQKDAVKEIVESWGLRDWTESKGEWAGLTSAFMVHRQVESKDKTTEETAFYITSLDAPPERLLQLSREHWKIESLHWMLDVVFSEDDCRILSPNGQKTMNVFRKFAFSKIRKHIYTRIFEPKPIPVIKES